jgi:hypothetical protein
MMTFLKRFCLTSVVLCGILVVDAQAAYRYVPQTIYHNGCFQTIWVKQWYPKRTVYKPLPQPPMVHQTRRPRPTTYVAPKPAPKPVTIINPFCE